MNADDFGQSRGITEGIIEAFERGIVTSTSLMVRGSDAPSAARYAGEHRRLSVGLHVDVGEWRYRGGEWRPVYEVVPLSDTVAVDREILRQLECFRELVGADPTHLDSHQHVHRREPVRSIVLSAAQRLDIPVRHFSPDVQYCGRFYGQTTDGRPRPEWITRDALKAVAMALPAGVSELACHPAKRIDAETSYAAERLQELAVLCDPDVVSALADAGIRLVSFRDIAAERVQPS